MVLVGGFYVFYYYVFVQQGQEVWVEFYYNYIYVNFFYGYIFGSYGFGSNLVVLELVVGDIVYLDIKYYDLFLYGGGDEVYSIFFGYLLLFIDSCYLVVG